MQVTNNYYEVNCSNMTDEQWVMMFEDYKASQKATIKEPKNTELADLHEEIKQLKGMIADLAGMLKEVK